MSISQYLELGWFLFPVQARGKAPLTATGFKEASNDPAVIAEWERQFPDCNWGCATGASRLVVVDVDTAKGGELKTLETAMGAQLCISTPTALTGGGGFHYVFQLPAGVDAPPTRLGAVHGVDVLARTGYIVVAPSVHPSGKSYAWDLPPWFMSPLPAPAELLAFLGKPKAEPPQTDMGDTKELFLTAGDARWDKCQMFAGRLRSWGWGQDAIAAALIAFAKHQCQPDPSIDTYKMKSLAKWACTKPAALNKPKRVLMKMTDGSKKLVEEIHVTEIELTNKGKRLT